MKRLTAIVVAITIALLMWVPARGERSIVNGSDIVQLPDPKPYVIKPCNNQPISAFGCIKPHGDQYWFITKNGEHDLTYRHTCRRSDGKHNGNKYPCVYYRGGHYLVYPVDIY